MRVNIELDLSKEVVSKFKEKMECVDGGFNVIEFISEECKELLMNEIEREDGFFNFQEVK